ncbi:MAG: hypothetical protein J6A67_07930 [Clostridia bacterium]|nr:hypothetical protein [Clostridia bacterium]
MNCMNLNGCWQGECFAADGTKKFGFSGTVPGCVHTDLAGDRIPEDIFYRDNADECQWIETCDWKYTKTFTLNELPSQAKLVFDGLDTYAEICLNGRHIASTDNMFISHSFSVADALNEGENTLSVYFRSPVREVEGLEKRDGAFTTERMHTRRIQCTYGWDWVARFVTCGIWRDVYLDMNDGFGVKNAYIYTENVIGTTAQIVVEAEFENYSDGGYADMEIIAPDDKTVYRHRWYRKEAFLKEYIDIPHAELWYPTGYGSQPIYTLKLCNKEYRFGIRTVTVLQVSDEKGSEYYNKCLEIKDSVSGRIYDKNEEFSGFQLFVNGTPIMCKGANWVPSEPFPSAESDKKISRLLSLAVEAGVNMLRVWGGGIFEKQHFYDECDRLGILVTQDFLMACGHYPEEKAEFIEQLKKETEFAAYALRNHPSLVWWSGDNENAVWGSDEDEDYKGRTAVHEGIMPVLLRLDPKRRFMLSSPCGGKTFASKTVGTTHNTQYLGDSIFPYIRETDMTDYKEFFASLLARFIAEEPTSGAVSLPSLRKFMTDEDIFDSDEMWQYHTKSNPCLDFTLFDLLLDFSHKVLGDFVDGKDRYFKMKYAQYEWIRVSMENIRRNRGFINGIVYWMWNDCWSASSGWAFVDYYCLPKASFYSFKRCAAPLLVSIDKKEDYEIYLCNDSLSEKTVSLSLSYILDGQAVPITEAEAVIPSAKSEKVFSLPASAVPEGAVLVCDADCDRAFYKSGALNIVPTDAVQVVAQSSDSITLRAKSYVHAVELEGEFVFEDNYFSLLPNEERTVTFRRTEDSSSEELTVTGYTIK